MEIDLLLEKQRPLVYSLTMSNTMKYIVSGTDSAIDSESTNDHHHILNKLYDLKPVLMLRSSTGDFEVVECCRDKIAALRLMIELLSSEIISRGGYVQEVMISYNYLYGEAVELVNELKTRYHNATVSISEGSAALSVYTGPETISIGII
jgi:fatty acid-binding protein DegV